MQVTTCTACFGHKMMKRTMLVGTLPLSTRHGAHRVTSEVQLIDWNQGEHVVKLPIPTEEGREASEKWEVSEGACKREEVKVTLTVDNATITTHEAQWPVAFQRRESAAPQDSGFVAAWCSEQTCYA